VRADDGVAAEEVAHAAVEQLGGARGDTAGDAEAAVRPRHQFGVGVEIDDADALDAVAVHPPLERAGVAAGLHVGDDDRRGINLVGTDLEIVRQD
nr:hypothetical protein [Tanacetum cinerariifolium]